MDLGSLLSAEVIGALGAGAVLVKLLDVWAGRRPTRVAADVSISQSALEWAGRFGARMDQLEAQLAAAQETHARELRERDARVEQLEKENDKLRKDLATERRNVAALETRLGAELARVTEMQREMDQLAARVADLESGGKD